MHRLASPCIAFRAPCVALHRLLVSTNQKTLKDTGHVNYTTSDTTSDIIVHTMFTTYAHEKITGLVSHCLLFQDQVENHAAVPDVYSPSSLRRKAMSFCCCHLATECIVIFVCLPPSLHAPFPLPPLFTLRPIRRQHELAT